MDYITVKQLNTFIANCNLNDYDVYTDEFEDGKLNEEKDLGSGFFISSLEDELHYFITHKADIIGYLSLFVYEENEQSNVEISLIIHPDYRRHGFGRRLVNYVLSTLDENETNIYLTGSNEGFAESLGFNFSHSEHYMSRNGSKNIQCLSMESAKEECEISHSVSYMILEHKTFKLLRLYKNGISASSLRLSDTGEYINIWKVYTNKPFRNQGLATELVNYALALYPDRSYLLQVSGENKSAIRAYVKAGFKFIHTTEYYRLG